MTNPIESLCNLICDAIALERISYRSALTALRIARIFDRTESYHAAHIRDAIRDNFDDDLNDSQI